MSERAKVAERLAQIIRERDLTHPFGGDVTKTIGPTGRVYYAVGFSRPATLDGVVCVYSDKWILVETRGHMQMKEKFSSEEDAAEFLQSA